MDFNLDAILNTGIDFALNWGMWAIIVLPILAAGKGLITNLCYAESKGKWNYSRHMRNR